MTDDQTGGGLVTRDRVALYLALIQGTISRARPTEFKIPDAPATHIPESASEAYELGWRQGWIAGKFDTQ